MRFLKRILFSILLIVTGVTNVSASHLMGGEITWTCQGTGQFVFQVKLYRDCNGSAGPSSITLDVFNHPTLTQIPLSLITQTDISPQCNALGPAITCASAVNTPGAVEEFILKSAPITITGTPPAAGWIFVYSTCCRNNSISNINNAAGLIGFTLRAKMYAYNNQNTNPCYDNSPEFLESPKTIICTGSPFTYNHNAIDAEFDSLSYAWAQPLDVYVAPPPAAFSAPAIPFVAGFAFNNPMPGPALDPGNVPATINPVTGEISYTSFTSGNYLTCIKVEAWKCGQLVAEIYREMQVVLLPCGNNNPPSVIPPFAANTSYQTTVFAGTLVNFTLAASDLDLLPNGNPQTLTMDATGQEFGTGFTNAAAGCINPPCATLSPPLPVSGTLGVSTDFSWQTACNHVNYTSQCFIQSNTYNFIFRTVDDFCPAPAQNISTISITVLAQPVVASPDIHCISVQLNGDVTLTWEQPADPGGTFDSYHIYSSLFPNGPFAVIDSIFNYNQTTYSHVGANANAGPVYYYIQTRSGCGGQIFLPAVDTMSSIYLQVVNNANVTAGLTWNNISIPPPSTQFPWYKIYREYPIGTWVLLDSTQSLSYIDSIQVCNSYVNYRIEIGDSLGCTSVSNVDGDLFQDNVIPLTPVLDSVSVNINNKADLGWEPSTSPDVVAYVIYQFINGVWTPIDTVFGIGNTAYTNLISNAGLQSEAYAVAALDSCGNVSNFGPIHNTIYLSSALDICTASANLWWTAYPNLPGGTNGYSIYVSQDGGPFTLTGTVAGNDSSFVDTALVPFSTYCYYVQAFNTGNTITTSSQQSCVYANVLTAPLFNYLRVASVVGSSQVDLKGYVDIAADVIRYDFYREDTLIGPWSLIGNAPAIPLVSLVTFSDLTPETGKRSYYYKMVAIDSCNSEIQTSNIDKTIFLQAISNDEITNTLYWNDYSNFLGGVLYYNIYRYIDGVFDPTPIATIPFTNAGENVYVDDVSAFINFIGKFSYQIEAVEGPGNIYSFADSSYSNIALVLQKPLVFVPNAFSPNGNGLNDFFLPSTGFVDIEDYHFTVFDRWGEVLFETHDRNEGWNGRYKGHKCDGGVYVWLLTYKTSSGQYIDEKGTVVLLR